MASALSSRLLCPCGLSLALDPRLSTFDCFVQRLSRVLQDLCRGPAAEVLSPPSLATRLRAASSPILPNYVLHGPGFPPFSSLRDCKKVKRNSFRWSNTSLIHIPDMGSQSHPQWVLPGVGMLPCRAGLNGMTCRFERNEFRFTVQPYELSKSIEPPHSGSTSCEKSSLALDPRLLTLDLPSRSFLLALDSGLSSLDSTKSLGLISIAKSAQAQKNMPPLPFLHSSQGELASGRIRSRLPSSSFYTSSGPPRAWSAGERGSMASRVPRHPFPPPAALSGRSARFLGLRAGKRINLIHRPRKAGGVCILRVAHS